MPESAGTKGITEYIVTSDPYSLINARNSSRGPDPQNSDEVRYFLPRLLEFVVQGQFDNIHEVFSLRRINLASKENWREDEREILQQFACQYMTDWVSGDEAVELQYMLEMFFRADIALSPLLDAIISVPGFWSAASLACLLNTYRDGYIRDNQTISIKPLPLKLILGLVIINPS